MVVCLCVSRIASTLQDGHVVSMVDVLVVIQYSVLQCGSKKPDTYYIFK